LSKHPLSQPLRPLLLAGLTASIPAFYLQLTAHSQASLLLGSVLYGVCALCVLADLILRDRQHAVALAGMRHWRARWIDLAILVGALASTWPSEGDWSRLEWVLRLVMCTLVFLRLVRLMLAWYGPHQLFQTLGASVGLLAFAGGGFYLLEPNVHSYADGLWLAFTTGATVGYGDLVPSTPASRVFAVFIVLLGYAVFSVVTATIAALFVSADEKRFELELHHDIRALRREIDALRDELHCAVERDGATVIRATLSDHGAWMAAKEKGRSP